MAEGSLIVCETDKLGRFAIMSQEESLMAGEKHVEKDEEVDLEFLLKNQSRLNGHMSVLLKTFNAGTDWNHQARLRATKLTASHWPHCIFSLKIIGGGLLRMVALHPQDLWPPLVVAKMTIYLKA